jgi:hypothetical protein
MKTSTKQLLERIQEECLIYAAEAEAIGEYYEHYESWAELLAEVLNKENNLGNGL